MQAGIRMEVIIPFSTILIPTLTCITDWRLKKMTDKLLIHPLSGLHPEKTGKIHPTVITNGILNIQTETPVNKLQLISANGAMVFRKELNALEAQQLFQYLNIQKAFTLFNCT